MTFSITRSSKWPDISKKLNSYSWNSHGWSFGKVSGWVFKDLSIRDKKLTKYFQNTLMVLGKDIQEKVRIRPFSVSFHLFEYYDHISSIQESFFDSDLIIFSNKGMITRVLNTQNDISITSSILARDRMAIVSWIFKKSFIEFEIKFWFVEWNFQKSWIYDSKIMNHVLF